MQEYIQGFSGIQKKRLEEMRMILRKALPEAEEVISYGMPAFKYGKVLVFFAANKHHLGFYPTASGIAAFSNELKKYTYSKGAIQFPYEINLPKGLITRIAKMRLKETREKLM